MCDPTTVEKGSKVYSAVHSLSEAERRIAQASCQPIARPRDNRSPAASEGRYRGPDLAVTAGELNAEAGVGRLG